MSEFPTRRSSVELSVAATSLVSNGPDDHGDGARVRATGRGRAISLRLAPLGAIAIFLAVWEILGTRTSNLLFATPIATFTAFIDLIRQGSLLPALGVSMVDFLVGFLLAVVVGLAIGTAMGWSATFTRLMNPYINFFQATPLIALTPLIVIWFGIGQTARIAVTFVLPVWTIIITTSVGVRGATARLMDVGLTYHLKRRQVLRLIALPGAAPEIFTGLRVGVGKSLIGVIVAETEISIVGLGGLITSYGNSFQTAYLLAAMFTAAGVGAVAGGSIALIRRSQRFRWIGGTTGAQEA